MSASPLAFPRSLRALTWLLAAGCIAAALDMLVAIAYWSPHGISAVHVMQSIATWVLGPQAYDGGAATAVFGLLLYVLVLWGVAALYRVLARRQPVLVRHPLPAGALYGAVAYFAIFHGLVPMLTGHHPDLSDTPWLLTCIGAYASVVGIPCALAARASLHAERNRTES